MQKNLAFSMEEYNQRLKKVRAAMADAGLDLMLISSPDNMYYVSGYDTLGYYQYQLLLLPAREDAEPVFLVQAVEDVLANTTSWVNRVVTWKHGVDPLAMTVDLIREYGFVKRIGIEEASWWLTPRTYRRLHESMKDVEFVDASKLIPELRIYKSPAEIEYMRRAAQLADLGMKTAMDAVSEGVTEAEVAAKCSYELTKNGSGYPSSPFQFNSGPKTLTLHGTPSSRVISKGDVVSLELGGVWKRYTINILRTLVIGEPTSKQQEIHDILTEAVTEAQNAAKPGVPVAELDRITRRITKKYDHGRLHRTGYGLEASYPPAWMGNLSIHEDDPHILTPGMVFSIEPTLCLPEFGFSILLGNCVLITEDGHEVLSQLPLDFVRK